MATGLVKERPETTAETQEIEGFVFICNPAAGPKSGVNDSGAFVSALHRGEAQIFPSGTDAACSLDPAL